MANPNALFQSMQTTFTTLNNDKDADTRLEVWINKAGEKEAAYLDIQNQKFDDGSTKIFDVPKKNNPMKRAEIPGSWCNSESLLTETTHGISSFGCCCASMTTPCMRSSLARARSIKTQDKATIHCNPKAPFESTDREGYYFGRANGQSLLRTYLGR